MFSGYSQAATTDYTYLYYLLNESDAGTPTSFCNEHCFYGLDLVTLLDPTGSDIHTIGYDTGNGGEEPSFIDTLSPDLISYEFDLDPNYGMGGACPRAASARSCASSRRSGRATRAAPSSRTTPAMSETTSSRSRAELPRRCRSPRAPRCWRWACGRGRATRR